jgi:hypothetical protein
MEDFILTLAMETVVMPSDDALVDLYFELSVVDNLMP